MSAESERILHMIADGTISVEEAERLLECIGVVAQEDDQPTQTPTGATASPQNASHTGDRTDVHSADANTAHADSAPPNAAPSSEAQYSYEPEAIRGFDISWVRGSVDIRKYTGTEINIYETSSRQLMPIEEMELTNEDGIIKIKWDKRGGLFSLSSITALIGQSIYKKQLVVEIPESIADRLERVSCTGVSNSIIVAGLLSNQISLSTVSGSASIYDTGANFLKLSSVSGKVHAGNVSADEMTVKSTSGSISLDNIVATEIQMEEVSGKISLFGKAEHLKCTTVSGSCQANLLNCPSQCQINTVSGAITIFIPDTDGFQVYFNSMSGRFTSDFPVAINMKDKATGTATYGTQKNVFRFHTLSGSMQVKRSSVSNG